MGGLSSPSGRCGHKEKIYLLAATWSLGTWWWLPPLLPSWSLWWLASSVVGCRQPGQGVLTCRCVEIGGRASCVGCRYRCRCWGGWESDALRSRLQDRDGECERNLDWDRRECLCSRGEPDHLRGDLDQVRLWERLRCCMTSQSFLQHLNHTSMTDLSISPFFGLPVISMTGPTW